MKRIAGWPRLVGVVIVAAATLAMAAVVADTPRQTIADAARKVVKIHGAGGLRGLESYQTGILVSPQGHVLTVMSTVLDADEIDCSTTACGIVALSWALIPPGSWP
jgi:hypothetical protein